MTLEEVCSALEDKIRKSYETDVTVEEAEDLAAEFLSAQLVVSSYLKKVGLDARMRKRGFKATRSKARLEEVQKHDKKPTEGYLDDFVNTSELCMAEERFMDEAIESKEELQRRYDVFKEAHIYYRGIAKGSFNG